MWDSSKEERFVKHGSARGLFLVLLHFNNMRMEQTDDGIFSIYLCVLQFTRPSLQNLTRQITKNILLAPSCTVTFKTVMLCVCVFSFSAIGYSKRQSISVISPSLASLICRKHVNTQNQIALWHRFDGAFKHGCESDIFLPPHTQNHLSLICIQRKLRKHYVLRAT